MPTKKVQTRKSKIALDSSTSPSPALTNKVGPETLLPTEEIIKIARSRGVDFGPGNPFERIRYYIKHGILPHAVRKTPSLSSPLTVNSSQTEQNAASVNRKLITDNQLPATPVGHLPSWTVDRLVRIDRLFKRGLSYPQIAEKLKRHEASRARRVVAQKLQPIPPPAKPHFPLKTKLTFFATFALASLLLASLGSIIIDSYETDYYLTLQKDKSYKRANIKVLGIKDTAHTFWGEFLTATANLLDAIARPFGNLAAVFSGELSPQVIYQIGQLPQELAPTDHQDTSTQVSTNLTDSADLTAGSDLLIQNLTVTGQTTLGTGFTDYLILKGSVKSDILPATTKTYNLGSGGERWKSGYFSDNIYIGDENRIGVTGMNVKGSIYLETRSGGSIYLNPDSNNVYIGNSGDLIVTGGDITGANSEHIDIGEATDGTISFDDGTNTLFSISDQGTYGFIRLTNKGSTGDPATCSAGDLYFNATDATVKACTAANTWEALDAAAGLSSLTLSGDSGTDQTISDGNTIEIAGGTNGIDTVAGATDTITLNLDTTEIGTTTFGSGSSIVWTYNAGTTDPAITFGDNALTIASAATVTATDVTAFNCTDCIDFDDIANSPTLDESTDINLSTLDLFVDLTSTGVFAVRDVATAYWTFDDDSTVDVLFPAAGTIGIDASTTANTTTAGVINLDVTSLTANSRAMTVAAVNTATTGNTSYGIDNQWSSTAVVTGTAQTAYGIYNTVSKTGADTSVDTTTLYGIYSTATNTGATDAGTKNTYAAYFDATGDTAGTATVIGLYIADVSGGDTNVGLCFDCDGTYSASTVASGIQFGTDANAVTLYRSGNDTLKTDDSLTIGGGTLTLDVDTNVVLTGGISGITFDTNVLSIDAANNRVGIGTATPADVVDVRAAGSSTFMVKTTSGSFALNIETDDTGGKASLQLDRADATGQALVRFIRAGTIFWEVGPRDSSDDLLFSDGTNTLFTFDDTGTTGDLIVSGNLNATFATANTAGLCWDNAGASNITDCSSAPTDLAENFGTSDPSIEAGDIVMPDPERPAAIVDFAESDGDVIKATKAYVVKSQGPYNHQLIGIVSTQPNQLYGDDGLFESSENPKPISLAGRVPVKVSTENGPIAVGDPITSSSTSGIGMKATKAGRVVGVALESWNPNSSECINPNLSESNSYQSNSDQFGNNSDTFVCQSKILVFVNPTFYLGVNLASNGSIASNQLPETSDQITNDWSLGTNDLLNPDGTLKEYIQGQILTAEQIQRLVQEEVSRQLAGQSTVYSPQSTVDSSQSTVDEASASAEASSSAALAQQTDQTLNELNNLLSTTHLSLDTLSVTGNSHLAQTQVAGSLSQDGTLIIDYGRQVNVLGSTLYLQNDPLAGLQTTNYGLPTILVDIGAGAATIDKGGNLKTRGTLTAAEIQTEKVTITTSDKPIVGSATIATGSSQVTVQTAAVEPGSKILVTPTDPTGGKALYIASKVDFESFTVALDPALPAANPIHFDWLIIGSKQLSGN